MYGVEPATYGRYVNTLAAATTITQVDDAVEVVFAIAPLLKVHGDSKGIETLAKLINIGY